jgi:ERG2 and Sigma1 receptor like protein
MKLVRSRSSAPKTDNYPIAVFFFAINKNPQPMNLLNFARYSIPIVILFALLDRYFLGKTYIFSPERLQVISRNSIAKCGNDTELLMRDIHASLQAEYGDAILPYENKWVLNNAGGAMVGIFHVKADG